MKNKQLVMIPGPTPVTRSIQNQMGREVAAFGDPDFISDYKELIHDLKVLWKTEGEVFVVAGTGTMAMEMAIANTLQKDDHLLIVSHGFFGDRFIDICERKGIHVDVLSSEWGQIVPIEVIEQKLMEKKYQAVTVTHVDTSTGVKAPVEDIGNLVKSFDDTLFIVDGVCSTAGEQEYVDEMNIDILLTGTQKAFGVPPGLAILWAGPKAMERRKKIGSIPEYYIDFEKWLPIMHDPSKYFATPAVNMIWALAESVNQIKREGLEKRYARHKKVGHAMQLALEGIGFSILAEKEHRASTLSNVLYPEGMDDASFRKLLYQEGVMVAGGLGIYAGKMFRLGHMGNVDMHDLVATLAAIERALHHSGQSVDFGKSVGIFLSEMLS
ncbi:pyridoxal-phosphate-dependent aminotransferase family protein [Tindallia californiensis]|uniref:Aspartate aminotransferase n=1 Tax=Tindallia californiensis TaxID=159292 RepID=A0A1H3LKR9_9FIRM|nr:alanine--glyoxylate aminotransferase family protein [Tindallia californiensis]SDY64936.1 aspartate aminotransferase [Tindallia californiensis]